MFNLITMATIKFLLQSKSKNTSIYLRLSLSRNKSFKRKTGLQIDYDDWSTTKGLPKQSTGYNKNLNTDLTKLSNKIIKKLNKAQKNGTEVDSLWLKEQIDIHFKRIPKNKKSDLIIDAIKDIIAEAPYRLNAKKELGLSKSRINSYNALLKLIESFEKNTNRKLKIKDVNKELAKDLLKYQIDDNNYNRESSLKKIADLKTVCYFAEEKGIKTHPQLRKINSAKSKPKYIIYLTPDDLTKIENCKLTSERLINTRKWIILGVNLGQRVSDLTKITESNFSERNGIEVIELTQTKTGKLTTIPVNNKVKEIRDSGLPYYISDQNLNKYIKEVCKIAEINQLTEGILYDKTKKRKITGSYPKHKLICTHTLRRSFVSNLYGKMKPHLIMEITQHSSIKMLANYIGKSGSDFTSEIDNFYKSNNL